MNVKHILIMRTNQPSGIVNNRREFIKSGGIFLAGIYSIPAFLMDSCKSKPKVVIRGIRIEKGIMIDADNGITGSFQGSPVQDLERLRPHLGEIRELLIGKDPLDRKLEGEMLWESIYPGKAKLFAEGIDPLTGEVIAGKPRESRHTKTGQVFAAFSTLDIALWDLRGKLLEKPLYEIIGNANRTRVPVYWRPGEATEGLDAACRRAREAYDMGYIYQKWYFTKSAKDGKAGMTENIELVRRLREELPEAHLMFDNHSIRYYADVDYSVELCKAIAPYNPFWVEEPVCPEHVDGYARIKTETGVIIAGGEHLYTRWPVKAFLERNCIDYLQCDPTWCGGISEWLKICELAAQYPGVKVVPHITSPWLVAPHCVASQDEDLCPLLEYNYEGGRETLDNRMSRQEGGVMMMTLPEAPGLS
jgi:L-alanine-DL-glutamate epimerase-like enolase superfamily enzyme